MLQENMVILAGKIANVYPLKFLGEKKTPKLDFRLACTTPSGKDTESTVYVDCDMWGKQAENVAELLSQGCGVYIRGRLKTDSYVPKGQTEKVYKTKVDVSYMQITDLTADAPQQNQRGGAPARDEHSQDTGEDIPF